MGEKWVEGPTGYLELIDCETGTVIAREKRLRPPRKLRGPRRPGRPSKVELAQASANSTEPQQTLYDPSAIAENISAALISGVQFKSLGPQQGCPPQSVIARLRRENPEFSKQVRAAIETQTLIRQDTLQERLMTLVEDAKRCGDPGAARLACEVYKFLAQLNNPATYSPRRKRGRPRKSPLKQALATLGVFQLVVEKA